MRKPFPLDKMPPLCREFASHKLTIEGCTQRTVNQYLHDLRLFFRYMKAKREGLPTDDETLQNLDISTLSADFIGGIQTYEIYDFFMYVGTDRDNQWSAKAGKLSAVKAFYKFLTQKKRLIDVNPAIDVESPRRRQTLPKFLSMEESLSLLNAVLNDEESENRVRDYAILTLFLNCGMRLSELCGISIRDIDHDLRSLRVIGKGAKERIIYLNEACQSALQAYLEIRLSGRQKDAKTDALFISRQYKRISDKTVQWIVYKYLEKAGLGYKHYSVHKLRHTAATLMYQQGGVDVRVLKEILGHEQLNTTQIYTHVSNEGMEEAMRKNPLSTVKAAPGRPKKKPGTDENGENPV